MALTDAAIRAAKPQAKAYKLADEKGLYLLVSPSGGLLWRMKFRVNGVDDSGQPKRIEKLLSFGAYPEVSLKMARARRDDARGLQADGVDPALKKQQTKQAAKSAAVQTFAVVARDCIEKNRREGLAEATLAKRVWFLKLVSPTLGNRPISEIQPIDVLQAVRPIEAKGKLESARRTLEFIGQLFRFAVANQLVTARVCRAGGVRPPGTPPLPHPGNRQ